MRNDQPLVSVVIPSYNHESFIQDSIQSVINQTYSNIELIIIDDGSKDSSVSKIQEMIKMCEKRFTRFEFRSRGNIGVSATFNEALQWCQGKYFSPIASDDIMLESKIAIQVKYLETHDDVTAVFGGMKSINSNNIIFHECLNKERFYSFKEIIMHQYYLPTPTHMTRLDAIRKVGGYKSNLLIEDWYMWLKLSESGRLLYINHFFTLYRRHENNISNNLIKMQQGRLEVLSYFRSSIYYEKALKETKWINNHEEFMVNRNPKLFLNLLFMNPRKTTLMSIRYFKKYCIGFLN